MADISSSCMGSTNSYANSGHGRRNPYGGPLSQSRPWSSSDPSAQRRSPLQEQSNHSCAHTTTPAMQPSVSVAPPHASHDRMKTQLACLYTKHKTQKRRVWQDGRLVVTLQRATLYSATPLPGSGDPILDVCEVTPIQPQELTPGPYSSPRKICVRSKPNPKRSGSLWSDTTLS